MAEPWGVIDLFSGAGGMSYGFRARPEFRVVGAVDAEVGKPSSGAGSLGCNATYEANIGVAPLALDLATASPDVLADAFALRGGLAVLCCCAPCTGFSRTLNRNHSEDDARNSLVGRGALFVAAFRPQIFLMENARELIRGRFDHHYWRLERELGRLGYEVRGTTHFLDRFGLPQRRERALVVACRRGLPARTLDDLWAGYRVDPTATHVRRAIGSLPPVGAGLAHADDPMHASPAMGAANARRVGLIPKDGGSWADLRHHPDRATVLTPAMRAYAARGEFGSHSDVYGRMAWGRPAPTIKRECGHVGNGRYAHPEQDRLCTVRELATLQGLPRGYVFRARSLTNSYRHVGDAVPPLISYQLAALCRWMLTGQRPAPAEFVLPGTHLTADDIVAAPAERSLFAG